MREVLRRGRNRNLPLLSVFFFASFFWTSKRKREHLLHKGNDRTSPLGWMRSRAVGQDSFAFLFPRGGWGKEITVFARCAHWLTHDPPCGARRMLRAYADPCILRPLRKLRANFFCQRQRKLAIPPACADMIRICPQRKKADTQMGICFFGAAGQIRTADLILTKDALYLLSYSSKVHAPYWGHVWRPRRDLNPRPPA